MDELKPCPFCGGRNTKASFKRKHIRYNGYGNYLEWCSASVRCTKCHARGTIVSGDVFHGRLHDGEKMPEGTTTEAALGKDAIEAWNKRVEIDPVKLVEIDHVWRADDAVEVVHGRWERCGGDLHSSGYAIYCSVCCKTHFVHYKHSLGGLSCEELFEKPKYCPSCGAVMEIEE